MLLTARLARWFVALSFYAAGFLCAQDERPHLSVSPAIHDKTIVSEIHFYGDNELAVREQNRFEEMYKAECECDDVVKELAEQVMYLYQEHGYYKAAAHRKSHLLSVDDSHRRVSVDLHIEQNLQYRLRRLELTGEKAFSAEQLRTMFSIQSGDVFDVGKIREGLDNLRRLYGEYGYINLTPVPQTEADDDHAIIDLSIDLDEGSQFRIGTIAFSGTGAGNSRFQERILDRLSLKPGDVYNYRLLEAFFKENQSWLPAGSTAEEHVEIAQNAREHTVDLYFVFK
jgi:outer membrane protein insertion porin family